jgi:glutaryl-CoA dehydrogenase (non-decarboxylating)
MDFELSEELAEMQKLAHDFAEKEIAPSAAQDDREHRFRKDLVGKMGELGFYGCLIPEVEGSVNIQKLIIAQDALGYRKANR